MLVEIAISVGAMLAAAWVYGMFDLAYQLLARSDSQILQALLLSGLMLGISLQWAGRPSNFLAPGFLELLGIGAGIAFLLQSWLSYMLILEPVPAWVVLGGSALAAALVDPLRAWHASREKVIWLALSPEEKQLLGEKPGNKGLWVGEDGLEEQLRKAAVSHPDRIVLGKAARQRMQPKDWWGLRSRGIHVETVEQLYEERTGRIPVETLTVTELRWFIDHVASRRVQATQAIYSNLIGMALLVALLPLMLLLAVVSSYTAGARNWFEGIRCSGFQGVEFNLFRFHTRHATTGRRTALGRWIEAWHLTDLPQLINVVRGEMSLIGPPPMRTPIAERMRELLPFTAHRLTVRPGFFGWGQVHRPRGGEETGQLEYDLYYVKQATIGMDLEILLRGLTRRRA
jgi:lipopolysaccharide/colanic/teichoic acid biosynthesis glycosyltransferase